MKNPDFLPLTTPRLVLRRFSDEDVGRFLGYRNDPEVIRYQNWAGCTAAEAAEFIRRQHAQEAGVPGEWLQIAIVLKTTNELIGDCGVRIQAADARQANIGVSFARAWQGRDFAVEALSCLFDCMFRQLALHRVVVDTDAENTAMQKLAVRLARIFHIPHETRTHCSRRREGADAHKPQRGPPPHVGGYDDCEISGLGMRLEGQLRQSLWFKGRWVDEYLYGMLREEWLAATRPGEGGTP